MIVQARFISHSQCDSEKSLHTRVSDQSGNCKNCINQTHHPNFVLWLRDKTIPMTICSFLLYQKLLAHTNYTSILKNFNQIISELKKRKKWLDDLHQLPTSLSQPIFTLFSGAFWQVEIKITVCPALRSCYKTDAAAKSWYPYASSASYSFKLLHTVQECCL